MTNHKFINRGVRPDTEILIVGTFNPDTTDNPAKFFYGRGRNYLWMLLPKAFGDDEMKGKSPEELEDYIREKKIDFIDLIASVNIVSEEGKKTDYRDEHLDINEPKWRGVDKLIPTLKHLKKVVVTRKTFDKKVKNIKVEVDKLQKVCEERNIAFECLKTPARTYNEEKQALWTKAFTS